MSSIIRGDDNFDSTPPSFGRVVRTAGDVTTTSTSLVDVTGASITITTGANPVAYGVAQSSTNTTVGSDNFFNVDIDGVLQHGTGGVRYSLSSASYGMMASFSGMSAVLSAGSHTIKEKFRVGSGTGTIQASALISHMIYAHEVK
jgi:hypothetical protein|tara:strand:+ start:357 stop:791 length:435 start_codon:yes stop_codon:yes gene_type:complete